MCTFLLVEGVSPTASPTKAQPAPGKNTEIGAYCEFHPAWYKPLDPGTRRVHLLQFWGQREREPLFDNFLC